MADSYYNKIKPYKVKENEKRKTIVYQLVDNFFPLSTEELQREIEKNPLCLDKTEGYTKFKTRYIEIVVRESMDMNEILNFGKRISIIEQRLIVKSKEFVESTINKSVANCHMNFIKRILESLKSNELEPKDIISKISKYIETAQKPIKSRATRSEVIKKK